jgi:hypothetical protein
MVPSGFPPARAPHPSANKFGGISLFFAKEMCKREKAQNRGGEGAKIAHNPNHFGRVCHWSVHPRRRAPQPPAESAWGGTRARGRGARAYARGQCRRGRLSHAARRSMRALRRGGPQSAASQGRHRAACAHRPAAHAHRPRARARRPRARAQRRPTGRAGEDAAGAPRTRRGRRR